MITDFFTGLRTRFFPKNNFASWEVVEPKHGDESILDMQLHLDVDGQLNTKTDIGLPLEDSDAIEMTETSLVEKSLDTQEKHEIEVLELDHDDGGGPTVNVETSIIQGNSLWDTHLKHLVSTFIYKFGFSVVEFIVWRSAEYMITVSLCYFFPALSPFIRVIYVFYK